MGKVIMIAIIAYLLWTAICYIRWRTPKKEKKSDASQNGFLGKKNKGKFDIVGKSKFNLSHSQTQAATTSENEKATEKQDTFAAQSTAIIPSEELDEVFSDNHSEDENQLLDIDCPLEYEPENEPDEEEEEEIEGALRATHASGIRFDEMVNMFKTVDQTAEATPDEKVAAGNTLLEIRQTDAFEELVSSKPNRKEIVSKLIEESLAAFYRQMDSETENIAIDTKALTDFDIQNYL